MELKLKAWRIRRTLSQAELAEQSGISKPSIVALEKADHRTPHPRTVRRLATALEIEPQELYRNPPSGGET